MYLKKKNYGWKWINININVELLGNYNILLAQSNHFFIQHASNIYLSSLAS